MSMQLPPLLASTSSLLPESLGAIMGAVSLGDTHSLLILLTVVPSIVMLVILGIHFLGRSRIDAEPDSAAEPQGEAEPDNLARFMQDTIEQLNGIAVVLRNTTQEVEQVPGQEVSTTTELWLPPAQDDERRSAEVVTAEGIAERLATLDEMPPGAALLPPAPAIDTTDKALAQLANKMHKLAELARRMQAERLAIECNSMSPQLASDSIAASRHYLSFALGDEQFAVSMLNIHCVVEATQLIAEPSVPPKVRRAISLQGTLVPVLDLGACFGGQPIEIGWSSRIVVLEMTNGDRLQLIGVVVDTVGKVLEVAPSEIEPPALSNSWIRADFALGTIRVDNRTVTVIDIGRGYSADELIVLHLAARSVKQEYARE